jgi:hypothetical protein
VMVSDENGDDVEVGVSSFLLQTAIWSPYAGSFPCCPNLKQSVVSTCTNEFIDVVSTIRKLKRINSFGVAAYIGKQVIYSPLSLLKRLFKRLADGNRSMYCIHT